MSKRPKIFEELDRVAPLIPTPVYWLDTNYVIIGGNDLCLEAIGSNAKTMSEALIGKTYYDYYPKDIADELTKMIKIVLETNETTKVEEKITDVATGKFRYYQTVRAPLFENNKVVGSICTAIEITHKKEAERLAIENATHKGQIEAETEFLKIVSQVFHDINSPLASLSTLEAHLSKLPKEKRLPEQLRIELRRIIRRITDIINNLKRRPLGHNNEALDANEDKKAVLLSVLLKEILSEKSYEYDTSSIILDSEFQPSSRFIFVNIQVSQFSRALSNLINNAVQAFEGNQGTVILKLRSDEEYAHVHIVDNGKGMPPTLAKKMENNISFTHGKKDGHGIGIGQVHDMLQRNFGNFKVKSKLGHGTTVSISFPIHPSPPWAIDTLEIEPKDTIIILDDEPTAHSMWSFRLESVIEKEPSIQVHHFESAIKAIKYINSKEDTEKDHFLLLTDFELLNQDYNGLDVIKHTNLKRTILVTSHYTEDLIQKEVIAENAKLLPKELVKDIPIIIKQPQVIIKSANAIWLDDDSAITDIPCQLLFPLVVDVYRTPYELMKYMEPCVYDKNIAVFLDYNFNGCPDTNGILVAEQLHKMGFTKLYLLSGQDLTGITVPDYLNVLPKSAITHLKDYF